MPDREANIAVAEIRREFGKTADLLRRQLAEFERDADPVQARLLLRMHADMREAIINGTRRDGLRRDARQLAAELLLDDREELVEAPRIQDILQT